MSTIFSFFVGDTVKVISADSGAALLDEHFQPTHMVASVAVLVEPPYREPSLRIAEPIFKEVDNSLDVIVHEAELCHLVTKSRRISFTWT